MLYGGFLKAKDPEADIAILAITGRADFHGRPYGDQKWSSPRHSLIGLGSRKRLIGVCTIKRESTWWHPTDYQYILQFMTLNCASSIKAYRVAAGVSKMVHNQTRAHVRDSKSVLADSIS